MLDNVVMSGDDVCCSVVSLLTCKLHNSALEYSIIRRYTNVVDYYYYKINNIVYFSAYRLLDQCQVIFKGSKRNVRNNKVF